MNTTQITWTHDYIGHWTLTAENHTAQIVRDRSQTTGAALFPWSVSRNGARVGSGISGSLQYAQADAERLIAGQELRNA